MNGIKHTFSALITHTTNGQAERAVQSLKRGLREMSHGTVEERLTKFLLSIELLPIQQQVYRQPSS